MAIKEQRVTGFRPFERSKPVGAWAEMNAADPLVAKW